MSRWSEDLVLGLGASPGKGPGDPRLLWIAPCQVSERAQGLREDAAVTPKMA